MPRVLDITAASDRLALDAQRRATALFTVTNPGAADVAGSVELTCLDGGAVAECGIQGPVERVFKPGVTTSVVCTASVPANIAGGSYRLRLDVRAADAALGIVRGPEIVVVVPDGAAPAPSAGIGRGPLIAILIVVALVVVGGVVALVVALSGVDDAPPADAAPAAETQPRTP